MKSWIFVFTMVTVYPVVINKLNNQNHITKCNICIKKDLPEQDQLVKKTNKNLLLFGDCPNSPNTYYIAATTKSCYSKLTPQIVKQ